MFDIQARHASLVGVLRQIAAGTVSDPQSWAQRIVAGIDAEIRPIPRLVPADTDPGEPT